MLQNKTRKLLFMLLILFPRHATAIDEIEELQNAILGLDKTIEIFVNNKTIDNIAFEDRWSTNYFDKSDLLETLKKLKEAISKRQWKSGIDGTLTINITNNYLSNREFSGYKINLSVADTAERMLYVLSGAPNEEKEIANHQWKNYKNMERFLDDDPNPHIFIGDFLFKMTHGSELSTHYIQEFYEKEFPNEALQIQKFENQKFQVWKKGKSYKDSSETQNFYGSLFTYKLEKKLSVKIFLSLFDFIDVEIFSENDIGQIIKKTRVRYFADDYSIISAKSVFMNKAGEIAKVRRLNREGIIRDTYWERDVFSLKHIYAHSELPQGKSLDALLNIAQRHDRIKVAIIDSGIDYNHPDLAYKISRSNDENDEWRLECGFDFEKSNNNPYDYSLKTPPLGTYIDKENPRIHIEHHGTPVAGIAAKGNDDIEIIPIRVSFSVAQNVGNKENNNDALNSQRKKAVDYADEKGVRIVNLSMIMPSAYLMREITAKYPKILFIKGAGNGGGEARDFLTSTFPENLIVVAASNNDALANFSNRHKVAVQLAAPGYEIYSTLPEKMYGSFTGTSFAAPHVTHTAARILAINPELSPKEVRGIILSTVRQVADLEDKTETGGILDEEAALSKARETLVRL